MQAESRLKLQLQALGDQASRTAVVCVEKSGMEEERQRGEEGEKEGKEESVDDGEEEKGVQGERKEGELVKEEYGGEDGKMIVEEKEGDKGGEEEEGRTHEGGTKDEVIGSEKMGDRRREREGVDTEDREWEEAGEEGKMGGAERKEKTWVLLEGPSQLKQEERSTMLSAISAGHSASTEGIIMALIDEAINDCDPEPVSGTDAELCGQRTSSNIPTSSDVAQQQDSHDDGSSSERDSSHDSKCFTSVTETSIASIEELEQAEVSSDLRPDIHSSHATSDIRDLMGESQKLSSSNQFEAVADFENVAPEQHSPGENVEKVMSDPPCHVVQSQLAHLLHDTRETEVSPESEYPISTPLQSSIPIPPRANAPFSTDILLPSTIEQSIQKQLAQVCFSPRSYTDFKDHLEHISEMILPWESLRKHSKCSCGISFSFTARKVCIHAGLSARKA